jgi:phage baseplate assembly protein W
MPGFGPKLPLSLDKTDIGHSLTKTAKQEIEQNVKILMLTSPGEKVFDSDFGVGIRQYLFENYNWETEQKLKSRIVDQFSKYINNVKIIDIIIKFDEGSNTLYVNFEYFILKPLLRDLLSLEFARNNYL